MSALRFCIPKASKGQIIVTTQNLSIIKGLLPKNFLRLGPLGLSSASKLLLKKLKPSPDRQNVDRLVEELGGHPLTITQVASYIRETRTELEDFLNLQREVNSTTLTNPNYIVDGTANDILKLPFHLLESSAADVLSFMSMLDCNGISKYLLRAGQGPDFGKFTMTKALERLRTFSFITDMSHEREIYSIHRLVRARYRFRLKAEGQLEVRELAALNIMSRVLPHGDSFQHRDVCAELMQHALAVLEGNLEVPNQETLLQRCQLSKECGAYFMATGAYARAQEIVEAAYLEVLGPNDERTISCLALLGRVRRSQGRYKEADDIIMRALSNAEQSLGPDHEETLTLRGNTVLMLIMQERYDEAKKVSIDVLERSKKVLGPEHPGTWRAWKT